MQVLPVILKRYYYDNTTTDCRSNTTSVVLNCCYSSRGKNTPGETKGDEVIFLGCIVRFVLAVDTIVQVRVHEYHRVLL